MPLGVGRKRREEVEMAEMVADDAPIPHDLTWTLKRRPTINDVARLSGVSKKTVSRVINQSPLVRGDTRERVQTVIDKIGFEPDLQARGLASQRSFLLGLVYDNPNAQYVVKIQEGVLEASRRAGYELVVHPCDRTSPDLAAEVRHFVERQKLDGVILLPPVSENEQVAAELAEADCRYVRVLAAPIDRSSNTVLYYDWEGAAEVAEHLADLGHRRIGYIAGPRSFRSAHERDRGFRQGLARRKVALDPGLVVEGAYTFESGEACAADLLARNDRPTAIFACNDEMAAGVLKVAYRLGLRVPEELSVVGFDDSPLASRLWPSLTTVRLPIKEMGQMAAEKLIQRIVNPGAPPATDSIVVARLVVRESTAKAP